MPAELSGREFRDILTASSSNSTCYSSVTTQTIVRSGLDSKQIESGFSFHPFEDAVPLFRHILSIVQPVARQSQELDRLVVVGCIEL